MTLVKTEQQFVFTTEKLLADAPPMSDLTLEELISLIKFFPDCHLPKDLLFESADEKKVIKAYKYFYKGLSIWFENLAAKKRLSLDAITTNWQYFQPHARICAAQLELITALHQPGYFLYDYGDSPAQVWISLIYIQCKNALKDSGLLGKPVVEGKVEIIDHNLERLSQYDAREITAIRPFNYAGQSVTRSWDESPEDYITVLASDLAQQYPNFDEDYWMPYQKAVSKWKRKMKDCKQLQAGYLLPNGHLFITGKGKKIPKEVKSPKGFATSKM